MKFRYLIVHEDYTVTGTNDEKVAKAAAEFELVHDVLEGEEWMIDDDANIAPIAIPEETTYQPSLSVSYSA